MSQIENSLNEAKKAQRLVTVVLRVEVEVDTDLWTDSHWIAQDLEQRLFNSNDMYTPEAVLVLKAESD